MKFTLWGRTFFDKVNQESKVAIRSNFRKKTIQNYKSIYTLIRTKGKEGKTEITSWIDLSTPHYYKVAYRLFKRKNPEFTYIEKEEVNGDTKITISWK